MITTVSNYADWKAMANSSMQSSPSGTAIFYFSTGTPGSGTGQFGAYSITGNYEGSTSAIVLQTISSGQPSSFTTDFPTAVQLTGPLVSLSE